MKQYTVEQWFSLLPTDIRKKAIANTKKNILDLLNPSFLKAIRQSFVWRSSPEGHEYWREISEKDWGTPEENKPKK